MKYRFCPECGFELKSEYNFCPECGYKFSISKDDDENFEDDILNLNDTFESKKVDKNDLFDNKNNTDDIFNLDDDGLLFNEQTFLDLEKEQKEKKEVEKEKQAKEKVKSSRAKKVKEASIVSTSKIQKNENVYSLNNVIQEANKENLNPTAEQIIISLIDEAPTKKTDQSEYEYRDECNKFEQIKENKILLEINKMINAQKFDIALKCLELVRKKWNNIDNYKILLFKIKSKNYTEYYDGFFDDIILEVGEKLKQIENLLKEDFQFENYFYKHFEKIYDDNFLNSQNFPNELMQLRIDILNLKGFKFGKYNSTPIEWYILEYEAPYYLCIPRKILFVSRYSSDTKYITPYQSSTLKESIDRFAKNAFSKEELKLMYKDNNKAAFLIDSSFRYEHDLKKFIIEPYKDNKLYSENFWIKKNSSLAPVIIENCINFNENYNINQTDVNGVLPYIKVIIKKNKI